MARPGMGLPLVTTLALCFLIAAFLSMGFLVLFIEPSLIGDWLDHTGLGLAWLALIWLGVLGFFLDALFAVVYTFRLRRSDAISPSLEDSLRRYAGTSRWLAGLLAVPLVLFAATWPADYWIGWTGVVLLDLLVFGALFQRFRAQASRGDRWIFPIMAMAAGVLLLTSVAMLPGLGGARGVAAAVAFLWGAGPLTIALGLALFHLHALLPYALGVSSGQLDAADEPDEQRGGMPATRERVEFIVARSEDG